MKAILLDMYGVLMRQSGYDFAPWVRERLPGVTDEAIAKPWQQADRGEISSLEALAAMGFTGDIAALEREYLDTIAPMPGAVDFLRRMQGRYRLALLSNDPARWSAYIRQKHGLNPFFDAICVSGEMKLVKPEPRIYEAALHRLGLPAQDCLYVDDRPENLIPAAQLGMRTVLMGRANPAWTGENAEDFAALTALIPQE